MKATETVGGGSGCGSEGQRLIVVGGQSRIPGGEQVDPEIATLDPDNHRFPQDRRRLASGDTVIPEVRLTVAEDGLVPVSDFAQILADSFGIDRTEGIQPR